MRFINNNFYSDTELKEIGFASIGNNVLVSKKASIYSPEKIYIGSNVRIDDYCILSGDIRLGNYIHIAAFSALYGAGGIIMKDFSGISSRVSIYSTTDDYSGYFMTNPMVDDKYRNVENGLVILEKHALIGASCVILPNLTINEGTSVGAMSLVSKTTEPWSIYFGIPAKKIKNRSKKLLLLENEFMNEHK